MTVIRTLSPFVLLAAVTLAQGPLLPVDEAGYAKLIAGGRGKILLVDFWATWCAPCREEMPQLVALETKLKSKGVQLITISADEPEQEKAVSDFLAKAKVPAPVYLRKAKDDDAFIRKVDPKWSGALPALFLYDRQGRLVKSFIGATPMRDLEAAIARLN
jgi:thiol-disulfide isomerase/thioredoxin